jgi:hypothetical protein
MAVLLAPVVLDTSESVPMVVQFKASLHKASALIGKTAKAQRSAAAGVWNCPSRLAGCNMLVTPGFIDTL